MSEANAAQETSAPLSVEDRVANMFLGDEPKDEPAASPSEPQNDPPATDPQDDDSVDVGDVADPLLDDEPQAQTSASDDFEITYNGEAIKVSKDEAKNLAQLGHHLKQQQDRINAELIEAQKQAQQVQQFVKRQAEMLLRNLDLEVHTLHSQLQGIDQNALAAMAASDPAQYVQVRAQIDQLQSRYQAAASRRDQAFAQYGQLQQQVTQQTLASEFQLLQRLSPVFKTEAKAKQAREQVMSALKGARAQTVEAVANNAELMAMAYKAARYDSLVEKSRAPKAGPQQKAPQTMRPGAAPPVQNKQAAVANALRTNWKKASDGAAKKDALLKYGEAKFL